MNGHAGPAFVPLNIAVLTVSDTRTLAEDRSGDVIADGVAEAGHKLADRRIVIDDIYRIRAVVSEWIAAPEIQVVVTTGGTGFSDRDRTPEAIEPLLDRRIDGFGELFRQHSYEEIGSSTLQSRALAGMANRTVIACLPGSSGACRCGWNRVLREQLDHSFRPCNLAQLVV